MAKSRPKQSPRMLALIRKYTNGKPLLPVKPSMKAPVPAKRPSRKPSMKAPVPAKRPSRKPSMKVPVPAKRPSRKPSMKRSIKIKTIAQRIAELKEKINNSTAKQRLNNNASKVRNRTKKVSNRVRGYYKKFMRN